jgi:hypothetical protein
VGDLIVVIAGQSCDAQHRSCQTRNPSSKKTI